MLAGLRRLAWWIGLLVVGLTVLFAALGATYSLRVMVPDGVQGSIVVVQGVPLRVIQSGAGRDLLFIHGSSGMAEDFAAQTEALEGSFRVTRYDRPGHGYSGDSGRYGLADNAAIAEALITRLGLHDVIVIGHSYGGATALALALRKPKTVSAYVVLDSAAYRSLREPPPLFYALQLPVFGQGIARAIPGVLRERMVGSALEREFRAGPAPREFLARSTPAWSEPKVLHAMANEHLHASAELATLSPHYREIHAPLYILAQRDAAPRVDSAKHLQKDVSGAELALIPKTGHYLQIEQAEVVNALIRRAGEQQQQQQQQQQQ